jgi:hypothetical protein
VPPVAAAAVCCHPHRLLPRASSRAQSHSLTAPPLARHHGAPTGCNRARRAQRLRQSYRCAPRGRLQGCNSFYGRCSARFLSRHGECLRTLAGNGLSLEALSALGGDVVASALRARFANMRLWDASTGEGVPLWRHKRKYHGAGVARRGAICRLREHSADVFLTAAAGTWRSCTWWRTRMPKTLPVLPRTDRASSPALVTSPRFGMLSRTIA